MVNLDILCTFTRMRSLLGIQAPDVKFVTPEIIQGVSKSLEPSTLLKVSEDGQMVGRKHKLDLEAAAAKVDARSLHVRPFPWRTTMEDIETTFKDVGKLLSIRLRRHPATKDFKGSAFLEFETEEEAHRVQELDIMHKGAKLVMEKKVDAMEREKEEEKEAAARAAAAPVSEAPASATEGKMPDYTPGVIVEVKIEGEVPETFQREDLKELLGGVEAGVKFIEYVKGQNEGYIRFDTPEHANAALEKVGDGIDHEGKSIQISLLEGEAEVQYWRKVEELQRAKRDRSSGGRSKGFGGSRGRGGKMFRGSSSGRGRRDHSKRPRESGDDNASPAVKKQAVQEAA